jgi:hypothetical protein
MHTLASAGPYNINLNYSKLRYHKEGCEKLKVQGDNMKKTTYRCIQEMNHWAIAWGVACKLMGTIDFHHLPPSSMVPSKSWLSTLQPKD